MKGIKKFFWTQEKAFYQPRKPVVYSIFTLLVLAISHNLPGQAGCDEFYIDLNTYQKKYPMSDISQYMSMIGLQKEATIFEDTSSPNRIKDFNAVDDYDSAGRLLCADIKSTLKGAISRNNIVIINESHNMPQSRAELYSLIEYFKESGYKDIFMETLNWIDPLREKYNIPDLHTGYFSKEVIYGDVIRKVIASDIDIHPYEEGTYKIDTATSSGQLNFISRDYPDWIPIKADTYLLKGFYDQFWNRDVQQALFIYQKVLLSKISKFIVFCGYGHGARNSYYDMGNILRYLTKDKTVTIDQVLFRERSSSVYDYELYTKYSMYDPPMIISHTDHSPIRIWNDSKTERRLLYDYFILSPRVRYKNNRPNWQTLNGSKHYYSIDSFVNRNTLPQDYLVIVYYKTEYDKIGNCAVAADVVQVLDNKQNYDLVLFPYRKYYLTIKRGSATILSKEIYVGL